MARDDLLSLREAANLSGRPRKVLLALVERGALPAIRREDKWLVSRADLALLYGMEAEAGQEEPSPEITETVVVEPGPIPLPAPPLEEGQVARETHPEMLLLLEMLKRRDEQIAMLQEQRAQLSGQIGFLQGLLVERETRLRLQEALPDADGAADQAPWTTAARQIEIDTATSSPGGSELAPQTSQQSLPFLPSPEHVQQHPQQATTGSATAEVPPRRGGLGDRILRYMGLRD